MEPEKISYLSHHFSHAVQAFMGSGFEESAILIVDAVGDWACTALYKGKWEDGKPKVDRVMEMPGRTKIQVLAPVVRGRKGEHQKEFEAARKGGSDLVMLGSHGHGALKSLVLGSVANRVIAGCETPVLIIR